MPSKHFSQYVSKSGRLSTTRLGKKSILIPIPKEDSAKDCSNHRTIAVISQASKVMLKILHARLQHYAIQELPDVQARLRKGRGTRDHIANICGIIEKAREFQKNNYCCFTDYAKACDCVNHNKLWKTLEEMGIPDHLTVSSETCMQVKKQQLEPYTELTGSKLRKEYKKAVYYYHPIY